MFFSVWYLKKNVGKIKNKNIQLNSVKVHNLSMCCASHLGRYEWVARHPSPPMKTKLKIYLGNILQNHENPAHYGPANLQLNINKNGPSLPVYRFAQILILM